MKTQLARMSAQHIVELGRRAVEYGRTTLYKTPSNSLLAAPSACISLDSLKPLHVSSQDDLRIDGIVHTYYALKWQIGLTNLVCSSIHIYGTTP